MYKAGFLIKSDFIRLKCGSLQLNGVWQMPGQKLRHKRLTLHFWTSKNFRTIVATDEDSGGWDLDCPDWVLSGTPEIALVKAVRYCSDFGGRVVVGIDGLEIDEESQCCGRFTFVCERAGRQAKHCWQCGGFIKWVPKPLTLERALEFTMPFGSHKGKKLADLTDEQLEWYYENLDGKSNRIGELCGIIYESRK